MSSNQLLAPRAARCSLFLFATALFGCSREVLIAGGSGGASNQAGQSAQSGQSASGGPASSGSSADGGAGAGSLASTGIGGAGTSSVSTGGLTLTGDVLDPNEVYVAGPIYMGNCGGGGEVLAHWSDLDHVVMGFECYSLPELGQVQPSDGHLVYKADSGSYREFRCDGCPFQGTLPQNPIVNDPLVPTLGCGAQANPYPWLLVAPDGPPLHTCLAATPGPWFDPTGNIVFQSNNPDPYDAPMHLGYGGIAITESFKLIDLTTSTVITPIGLPLTERFAVRALPPPDAFLVVLGHDMTMGLDGSQDVWKIDRNGVMTLVGPLPPLPFYTQISGSQPTVIDGHGAVFQFGLHSQDGDVVLRRTVGGTSDIIFSLKDKHTIMFAGIGLVTGP